MNIMVIIINIILHIVSIIVVMVSSRLHCDPTWLTNRSYLY
mgnify:CR=1 FL=1